MKIGKGQRTPYGDDMSLAQLNKSLRNPTMDSVVASLGERRVAVLRCAVLGLVVLWVILWRSHGTQPVLVHDARSVFPWALGLFLISLGWLIAILTGRLRVTPAIDATGTVANFLIIAVLTKNAFLLLITLEAILPFLAIAVGARYPRRWFNISVGASLAILLWSAPSSYWFSRPAYLVYAVVLTVGLPLLIGRILSALREITVQAIDARDAQNRFVGAMSHEMRTPLNVIVNTISLIDKNGLSPDQCALVEQTQITARALSNSVDNVLDITKQNSGSLAMANDPLCLYTILETVCGIGRSAAGDAGIEFTTQVANHLPNFLGDAGRVEQVLVNLVANAIKYTPRGGRVSLKMEAETDGKAGIAQLICTVTDTGIGIPGEHKARIFEPFYQVSAGATRSHEGVGLGLFIVHQVTERLGGALRVIDNPGGGTVFTWSVPLQLRTDSNPVAPRLPVLEQLRIHRESVRALRCLIVDDHNANIDVMCRLLEGAGHSVSAVMHGQPAIEALRRGGFDVAFLDLHMPGLSGWDVLDAVAGDSPVPIVVVSADDTSGTAHTVVQRGATAFLIKPIDAQRLLSVLASIARGAGIESAGAPVSSPLLDLRQMEGVHHVQKLLLHVEQGLSDGLTALDGASSAMELAQSLHKVANELGTLGMHDAANYVATVEHAARRGETASVEFPRLQRVITEAMRWIASQPEYSTPMASSLGDAMAGLQQRTRV